MKLEEEFTQGELYEAFNTIHDSNLEWELFKNNSPLIVFLMDRYATETIRLYG